MQITSRQIITVLYMRLRSVLATLTQDDLFVVQEVFTVIFGVAALADLKSATLRVMQIFGNRMAECRVSG